MTVSKRKDVMKHCPGCDEDWPREAFHGGYCTICSRELGNLRSRLQTAFRADADAYAFAERLGLSVGELARAYEADPEDGNPQELEALRGPDYEQYWAKLEHYLEVKNREDSKRRDYARYERKAAQEAIKRLREEHGYLRYLSRLRREREARS